MEMKANKIEFSKENYLLVMKALSKYGDESLTESIIEEILEKNVDDIRIQTALIDVWVSKHIIKMAVCALNK